MNAQIHAQLESAGELHARSMELADRALVLRLEGSGSESRRSLEQAFELERDAADLLSATDVPALSRSVYHRSAASLAIQVRDWDEARRLVEQGLWGIPPQEIAVELEELKQLIEVERRATTPFAKPVQLRSYETERAVTYVKAFVTEATDSYRRATPA